MNYSTRSVTTSAFTAPAFMTFPTAAFFAVMGATSASRLTDIGSPAIAFIRSTPVLVPTVPGCVIVIMLVGVVTVARISIVSQPERIAGGIIITGIIKPRVIGTGVIIIITVIAPFIIIDRYSSAGDTPVESVVPSLLVRIVRVEAGRVFFKNIRSVACRKVPAIAPPHKAHLVGRRLLRADHGIHLLYAGGLQRLRPLISGRLIPTMIMRVAP